MRKHLKKKAFIEKGESLYKKLQTKLEKKHKGDVVAIDPESKKFVVGKDTLDAALKAKKQHPDKIFYFMRIGFPAVHKLR